jgi:20S proteasome alpha/beta subunit
MKNQDMSLTEIRQKRSIWFKERVKPGMTTDEAIRLNEKALRLFPRTEEERRQKTESLMAMREFVL